MSRTIKFLISNWPRCEYSASFYRQGSCFWPFSPWSRVGHALRPIFMFWLVKSWQVSSCGKFMQHLETWLLIPETDRVLCNIVNQWSVLAILLFAKNADNENKKGLKKSKKSRLCPGPFLCLVFLAECTRLTAVKKWREILGNCGINLQVFICSCTLCSGNVSRCRIFTSKFRWTRNT